MSELLAQATLTFNITHDIAPNLNMNAGGNSQLTPSRAFNTLRSIIKALILGHQAYSQLFAPSLINDLACLNCPDGCSLIFGSNVALEGL
jgi:hypothetical protein